MYYRLTMIHFIFNLFYSNFYDLSLLFFTNVYNSLSNSQLIQISIKHRFKHAWLSCFVINVKLVEYSSKEVTTINYILQVKYKTFYFIENLVRNSLNKMNIIKMYGIIE